MRTIEYAVTLSGITPQDTQDGGIQGDHKVTSLVFRIETELWNAITANVPDGHSICYRVDVSDGSGGFYASELLTPDSTDKTITFPVPREITQAGGVAQLFLVISDVDQANHESRTLYSFPARIRFAASSSGTNAASFYYGEISGALIALLKALETFKNAFPIGTDQIADKAVTTPKLADGAVTTGKLAAEAVTAEKIPYKSISSERIKDLTIGPLQLAPDAVIEGKIADGAVTNPK